MVAIVQHNELVPAVKAGLVQPFHRAGCVLFLEGAAPRPDGAFPFHSLERAFEAATQAPFKNKGALEVFRALGFAR